jgi:hypothetical protein
MSSQVSANYDTKNTSTFQLFRCQQTQLLLITLYYPMRKLRLLLLLWIHKIFPEIFLTTPGAKKNISSITKIAKFLFKLLHFYK